MDSKQDSRQCLSIHRLIEVCDVKANTLLSRDLIHKERTVVLSAISVLTKLKIPITEERIYRVYPEAAMNVKVKLLEYIRGLPECFSANLLLTLYQAAQSEDERGHLLKTLGALRPVSEESIEFLRQKILYQNPSRVQRSAAMEGLGNCNDVQTLSAFVGANATVVMESDLVIEALRAISHNEDHEVFASLYRVYRPISEDEQLFSPMGRELIRAMFATYSDHQSIQALFVQLKDRLVTLCRSEDEQKVAYMLELLPELPNRDAQFVVRCVKELVLTRSQSDEVQDKKEKYFWQVYPRLKDNLQFKAIGSLVEKVLSARIVELMERKKIIESKQARDYRQDIAEFVESFGNRGFLLLVTSYFKKTPPDENIKKGILAMLSKAQTGFTSRQKALLPIFLKYMMNEDGRIRAGISVECGKVDLEKNLTRVFHHLRFLVSVCRSMMNPSLCKMLQQLDRIGTIFSEYRSVRRGVLLAILADSSKESFQFSVSNLMELPRAEAEEVLREIKVIELRWLSHFKADFSAKGFIPEARLHLLIHLLKKCPTVDDVDWQRILLQITTGDFGAVSSDISEDCMRMLSRSGNPGSLDLFSDRIRKASYSLVKTTESSEPQSVLELDLIFDYTMSMRNLHLQEYREQLLDLVFGCLKPQNEFVYTDLGYILYLLEDPEGVKILRKSFSSNDERILVKAVRYATNCTLFDVWPTVLSFVQKFSDNRLHNQVVAYFQEIRNQVDQVLFLEYLTAIRDGRPMEIREAFANAKLEDDEKSRLQKVFASYRTARGKSHRTQFEAEKQMKEKTIFFIDIAGYTKKSATTDIKILMEMLDEFGRIIEPRGEAYQGTLVKKIGDCYMYTFDTPLEAVMFAVEVQDVLRARNLEEVDDRKINTRVGMNTGLVFCMDKDVFGDPVNVASRMESNAPLNGIRINSTTYEPIKDFVVAEMQQIQVKGIDQPLETYVVAQLKQGVREAYFRESGL